MRCIDSHRIVLPLFAKDSWRLETGLFHLHFAILLSEDFRNKTKRRKHIFQIPLKRGLWRQIRSASHLHSRSLEGKIEAEAITLSHFVCFCLEICGGKQISLQQWNSFLSQPRTAQDRVSGLMWLLSMRTEPGPNEDVL